MQLQNRIDQEKSAKIQVSNFATFRHNDLVLLIPLNAQNIKDPLFTDETFITFGFGHLVELAEPGHYDEKWQNWKLESLPIFPDRYDFEVAKFLFDPKITFSVAICCNNNCICLFEKFCNNFKLLSLIFCNFKIGIYTIKALCSEKKIVNQIYKSLNDFFDVSLKRNMYDSVTQNLKIMISFLMSAFVLWIGSYDIVTESYIFRFNDTSKKSFKLLYI